MAMQIPFSQTPRMMLEIVPEITLLLLGSLVRGSISEISLSFLLYCDSLASVAILSLVKMESITIIDVKILYPIFTLQIAQYGVKSSPYQPEDFLHGVNP